MPAEKSREVVFELTEHLGVINTYPTGWKKELNLVSWNNAAPKFDIRDWDPDHEHMSRGITMHPEEAKTLSELLNEQEF